MIRHSETAKMSRTSSFFILGGQLASSGGRTLISDSLKLQLYQHRGQLNLLKVELYLKPPHLNIALWELAYLTPIIFAAFLWKMEGNIRCNLNMINMCCYVLPTFCFNSPNKVLFTVSLTEANIDSMQYSVWMKYFMSQWLQFADKWERLNH